jgi:prophage tail gpP-like protein
VAVCEVVWEDFGSDSPTLQQNYTVQVQPKSTRVSINSYMEADTFELELDYNTFPFDPRAIRSAQVSIHMADVETMQIDAVPNLLEPSEDNVVFKGFVDDEEMKLDDSTRTVTFKGRDFTSIYIDAKWPGKLLDVRKPVDEVLEDIVSRLKASGDITVENRTGSFTLPTLGQYYPDFGKLSGKRQPRKNETYWDVIQDIVTRAGLIAYIEIDKLVLTKPRTLYDPSKAVRMLYGHNLQSLELQRKLGKQKGFNLIVRSVIGKEVITAKIPLEAKNMDIAGAEVLIPKQSTKGALIDKNDPNAVAPYLNFVVANVRDKSHLIEIGEKIFEEIGRQQLEGKCKTFDMKARLQDKTIFDLLKLRNGTPLLIEVRHDDLRGILPSASVADRKKYLVNRRYAPQVASVLAETIGKFATPFYCRSVDFSLSGANGFSIDIDFINFIETAGKGLGI